MNNQKTIKIYQHDYDSLDKLIDLLQKQQTKKTGRPVKITQAEAVGQAIVFYKQFLAEGK